MEVPMNDGFRRSDEERLIAALNELDAARALTRKLQAQLGNAVSELARDGHSSEHLNSFEIVNGKLSEATTRYRRAVESFNAVCQNKVVSLGKTASVS